MQGCRLLGKHLKSAKSRFMVADETCWQRYAFPEIARYRAYWQVCKKIFRE